MRALLGVLFVVCNEWLRQELCAAACGDPGNATVMVDAVTALELVESMDGPGASAAALLCPTLHRLLGAEKSVRGLRALLRLVLRVIQAPATPHAETEVQEFFFCKKANLHKTCRCCWPSVVGFLEKLQKGLLRSCCC